MRRPRLFILIDLLFICCYLLYSVLPLSYAVDDLAAGFPVPVRSVPALQDIDPAPAALLTAISPVADGDNEGSSSTRVLLRKKRVISVSAKNLVPKPQTRACGLAATFDESDAVVRRGAVPATGTVKRNGYRTHRSGTSPPSPPIDDPTQHPSFAISSLPERTHTPRVAARDFLNRDQRAPRMPVTALSVHGTDEGRTTPGAGTTFGSAGSRGLGDDHARS